MSTAVKHRVLVVDDDESVREVFALLLRKEGYEATAAEQARTHQDGAAPVWIPRNGKDSNGIPYIVITCTECLRSFPLNVTKEENPEVLETQCLFCSNPVKYIIDFSLSVSSPRKAHAAPLIRRKGTAA